MNLDDILREEPTEYKKTLCNHYKLKIKQISKYLGFSLTHTANILNGVSKMTPKVEDKLNILIDELEKRKPE